MTPEHPINDERARKGEAAVSASSGWPYDEADARDTITNILHYLAVRHDDPSMVLSEVRMATEAFLSEIDGGDDIEQDTRAEWESRNVN